MPPAIGFRPAQEAQRNPRCIVKFIYPHTRYNSYERNPRGLSMPTRTAATDLLRVGRRLLWFVFLSATLGCSHERYRCQEGLTERILPPVNIDSPEERSSAKEP